MLPFVKDVSLEAVIAGSNRASTKVCWVEVLDLKSAGVVENKGSKVGIFRSFRRVGVAVT
jgi:hypothetical protein